MSHQTGIRASRASFSSLLGGILRATTTVVLVAWATAGGVVTATPHASGTTTSPRDPRFGVVQTVADEGRMRATEIDAFTAALYDGYDQPRAINDVDVAVLTMTTRYPDGSETRSRVQVFVPATAQPRGVYLFAPGSTGIIGPCRASREHVAGIRWGLYRAHVLSIAGQGFIGILPDYVGYEDLSLVQPYFHAASEAQIVFDALHAVDSWIRPRLPEGLGGYARVAAGFSQGGHAALAAADRNETLGGELYLHGAVGYGPTAEIEPLLTMYPSLAPMIMMSFLTVYGRQEFDPATVLRSQWAESLEYDTTRQCVGAMQSYYPSTAEGLFDDAFYDSLLAGTLGTTHPGIDRAFRANLAGLSGHGARVFIAQGTDDIVVAPKVQEVYAEQLRELGSDVDYRLYSARHDTRQVAVRDVMRWIDGIDPAWRPIRVDPADTRRLLD